MECKNYDGAVSALEDLISKMIPDDSSMPDIKRRLADAKAALGRKRSADHYKLLGLSRSCQQDEVS